MSYLRTCKEKGDLQKTSKLPSYKSIRDMLENLKPTEPVYCIHTRKLDDTARDFVKGFPGHVMYAVKANPHPEILRGLYNAGVVNFDTASIREIALVNETCPNARCFFMAISKLSGAAELAYQQFGVRDFVADHQSEVDRLVSISQDDIQIFIRMKAFDPHSVFELSSKFGAEESEVIALLRSVAQAGLKSGLSFNVGSLCRHPDAYKRAIKKATRVVSKSGVEISSLDIGGGFPIEYPGLGSSPQEEFFDAISFAIDNTILSKNCEILCEPGRALVADGQSIVLQVVLIKEDLVFLNDGTYGNFVETKISNNTVRFPVNPLRLEGEFSHKNKSFSVSGPTCDSFDTFPYKIDLPEDIQVGDWIEFELTGAYTNSMSSQFNGFYSNQWVEIL